jgi:choline dehydrogenase
VVACRLAENPAVSVLLLEAGGSHDVPSVMEANQWPLNLGARATGAFRAIITRISTDAPCLSLWARC